MCCVCPLPVEKALVNLASSPVSCREVIDVCSIQKACWETLTDFRQAPWTSRPIPRTWPNAFRNSQMAAIVGSAVSKCVYRVGMFVHLCLCACMHTAPSYVSMHFKWMKESAWLNILCKFCRDVGCLKTEENVCFELQTPVCRGVLTWLVKLSACRHRLSNSLCFSENIRWCLCCLTEKLSFSPLNLIWYLFTL